MKKFEFKSKICTTREQSEKLLALGLKKETADMSYQVKFFDPFPQHLVDCTPSLLPHPPINDERFIPAWSLGRLWELYWSNKVVCDCLFGCGKHMNPYAKMIALIEYDIEDGTFNKDYLEDEIK